MKTVLLLGMLAACGSDSSRHIADGGGGSGSGTAMPEPCALMISSAKITANATDTQCGQQLVNNTTIAVNFTAIQDSMNTAMSAIACTIEPGVVPQTLVGRSGTMGCNVEVDYFAGNGGDDEWDNASSGTVTVTVTDLAPLGGTMDITLFDTANVQLTVTGTF